MSSFPIIDIIFAVLVLILALRCSLRGFIAEVLSMASLVLGILAGILLYKNGAAFIRTKFLSGVKVLPEILAFIIIFFIVFILIRILESILKDIITNINLGGIDRFLGLFFGLFEGIVLVALVIFILIIQPLFDSGPVLRGSFFVKMLLPFIGSPPSLNIPGLPVKFPNV